MCGLYSELSKYAYVQVYCGQRRGRVCVLQCIFWSCIGLWSVDGGAHDLARPVVDESSRDCTVHRLALYRFAKRWWAGADVAIVWLDAVGPTVLYWSRTAAVCVHDEIREAADVVLRFDGVYPTDTGVASPPSRCRYYTVTR